MRGRDDYGVDRSELARRKEEVVVNGEEVTSENFSELVSTVQDFFSSSDCFSILGFRNGEYENRCTSRFLYSEEKEDETLFYFKPSRANLALSRERRPRLWQNENGLYVVQHDTGGKRGKLYRPVEDRGILKLFLDAGEEFQEAADLIREEDEL